MLGVNTPALPASLRRTNQRTILSLLLRMGRATRADLAKAAGISQPTAGKITTELLELGVLQQVDSDEVRRLGRPGQQLQLDRSHSRFLAVELGLRQTRVSALPVAFTEPDVWQHEFVTPQGPDAWASSLQEIARAMGRQQFWGALVSLPGIVDEERRKILFSPNLHWLEKVNFADYVQRAWEIPVEFVQEIRALALGQLVAAAGGEDFFLVDFGQGVGGAMVLNGQLFRPPMPLSGEFGHSPVPGGARRCGCGAVGCLETMVSEYGLVETFREHAGGRPRWTDLLRSLRQGPPPDWLMEGMDAAARVIAGALNVLGLHRVVVTGYLSEMPPAVFERLSRGIAAGAMWARFGEVRCELAPRRRAAGLVAAGLDRLVLPENEEGGRLLSAPLTDFRSK